MMKNGLYLLVSDMKNLVGILSIITLCSITSICRGQCPSDKGQFEISTTAGFVTPDEVTANFAAGDNLANGSIKSVTGTTGSTFVTIKYFPYNRLAFAISGGMNNENGLYSDPYNPTNITSTYKQTITTVAGEVYYIYSFRKYFEAYTLLGFGPAFTSVSTVTNPTASTQETTIVTKHDGLTMQYSPLCVRIGGRIGVLCEFGIGYKGVVNLGLSYKFGQPCWWRM
jgi:hypothetical protein